MHAFVYSAFVALAAAGTLAAFAANDPDRPEQPVIGMDSVGPREPILAFVGSKRVIAFHVPAEGRCALHAVVWDEVRATHRAGRIRVSLKPNEGAHIDSDKDRSLDLQCGDDAKTLAVASGAKRVVFGSTD